MSLSLTRRRVLFFNRPIHLSATSSPHLSVRGDFRSFFSVYFHSLRIHPGPVFVCRCCSARIICHLLRKRVVCSGARKNLPTSSPIHKSGGRYPKRLFFLIDFHFHSLKFLVCIPGFSSSRQKSAANVGDYLIMKLLPEETEKRTWRRANQSHANDTERTLSRFNGQLRGIAGTGAWKCPHLPVDSMNIQWGNRAPCSRQ